MCHCDIRRVIWDFRASWMPTFFLLRPLSVLYLSTFVYLYIYCSVADLLVFLCWSDDNWLRCTYGWHFLWRMHIHGNAADSWGGLSDCDIVYIVYVLGWLSWRLLLFYTSLLLVLFSIQFVSVFSTRVFPVPMYVSGFGNLCRSTLILSYVASATSEYYHVLKLGSDS